jgi:flagellar basal body rod protein FlgG
MLRGLYNSAQAMLVKQRELNAISNNIANVNTSGYKKSEIVTNTFQEELILVQGRRKTSGSFMQTYVDIDKANLEQSNFDFTGSKFDVGIFGNVYFNVRRPAYVPAAGTAASENTGNPENPENQAETGETDTRDLYQRTAAGGGAEETLLTRAGQFELDEEGYLTLNKAGRVQGENGDILIGNDDFTIDADGNIFNAEGQAIDRLRLTYVPPDADVAKVGDNLFRYDGNEQLPDGEKFDVIQGAYEKSNVDVNKEMVQAMEVQRHYEANSSIFKYIDSMNTTSTKIATLSK